jgi:hypothetical protein
MATILGNVPASAVLACGLNTRVSRCKVAIGASGAATADADLGWTVVKSTTGVYTVTFPTSASTARAILKCGVDLSAALTVTKVVPTAISYTSGTATVKTLDDAATATEPASGDSFWLELISSGGISA